MSFANTQETLRPGRNARIEQNALGHTVSLVERGGWNHPWFTTPFWQPQRSASRTGGWAAVVRAGFVNGFAPVVRTTVGDLKFARGTFYGQLVDARTGAAESAQLARLAIGNGEDSGLPLNTQIDVPLYLLPPIQLTFRNLGWDGTADFPQFFLDRGVAKPPVQPDLLAVLSGEAELNNDPPPPNLRLLRAADIILHQPRLALTSSITLEPGIVTGISNVTQTLGVRSAAIGDRLKVFGTAKFQPPQNFSGATNLMVDDYEEPNWDEVVISTVYLLSPPNCPPGSDPDSTWQPFVRHSLFWNLHYRQPGFQIPTADGLAQAFASLTQITSVLGAGSGIAINFIAASLNDAFQGALNILTSQSLAGTFWTPTGGGTTSKFPDPPASDQVKTNNKAGNAAAARKAVADAIKRQKLDPDFPYEGMPFSL